jgi:RpiR family carbohydrate utilization transcriptional regulator
MLKVIDIITRLRQMDGTFPKREQMVADHVLANLETVAYQKQDEKSQSIGSVGGDGQQILPDFGM